MCYKLAMGEMFLESCIWACLHANGRTEHAAGHGAPLVNITKPGDGVEGGTGRVGRRSPRNEPVIRIRSRLGLAGFEIAGKARSMFIDPRKLARRSISAAKVVGC